MKKDLLSQYNQTFPPNGPSNMIITEFWGIYCPMRYKLLFDRICRKYGTEREMKYIQGQGLLIMTNIQITTSYFTIITFVNNIFLKRECMNSLQVVGIELI